MIGTRLEQFDITGKLGEGGMGVVYRAEDTRLGRNVAIKVLPEAFTADPERLARFEREARVLATLNHPGIAAIYEVGGTPDRAIDGSGHAEAASPGSIHYLVMEYVPGETLAQRLTRGDLATGDALQIARQLAEALEAAHEKGVVHRDLKPANIKIDSSGRVKILDFGLAKAMTNEVSTEPSGELAHSPTLTYRVSGTQTLLGTAAYMAPEQARGAVVDKRADIWSFGVVLWEMLTGRRLFDEHSVSDTLAAVLKAEIDLETLPADVPPAVHHLVGRCLDRDVELRLRDIGEARIALQNPASWAIARSRDRRPRSKAAWAWLALLVLTTGVAVRELRRDPSGPQAVEHFFFPTPDIERSFGVPVFDISPDARSIVWIQNGDPDRLVHRSLDSREPVPIPGTDGAEGAISFMPDGQSVLFNQGGWLKRVSLEGGIPVTIARLDGSATFTAGTESNTAGTSVVYAEFVEGPPEIRRVGLDGSDPETILEWSSGGPYGLPSFLPGDRSILYFAVRDTGLGPRPGQGRVEALRLDSGERVVLLENASHPSLLGDSWVAALDPDGQLVVFPVDIESLERAGSPTPVASGIRPHLGESYC